MKRNLIVSVLACVLAGISFNFANERLNTQFELVPAESSLVNSDATERANEQLDHFRPGTADRFIENAMAKLVTQVANGFEIVHANLGTTKTDCIVQRNRVSFCYAPGTSTELMEQLGLASFSDGPRFFQIDRWSSTATNSNTGTQGDPVTLTYSFPPDGTTVPAIFGDIYPTAPNNFRARMNSLYGSEAQWRPIFDAVFARWSQVCGITFVYEPNDDGAIMNFTPGVLGVRGDLRIGGKPLDGNSGVLAYNNFPDDGDMVFDTNDNYYDDTSSASLKLKNIISHEHGHGMGLLHSCPLTNSKLMEPFINTNFEGPQHDDILGAQSHYGDPYEPNNSLQSSTNMGSIAPGSQVILGDIPPPSTTAASLLSISTANDSDWFRLSIPERCQLSITVEPQGLLYSNSPQDCSGQFGGCCSGVNVHSLQNANLKLEVRSSDGSTVIAASDHTNLGGNESLEYIAEIGDYFAIVSETNNPAKPQFYKIRTQAQTLPIVAFLFPQGVPTTIGIDEPSEFTVQIITTESIIPDSAAIHFRLNDASYQSQSLTPLGGEFYSFQLSANTCGDTLDFYLAIETLQSGTHFAPAGGILSPYHLSAYVYPECVTSLLLPIPTRRDHIYDPQRNILYVTTSEGQILPWDVANGILLPPLVIGGNLWGIDIAESGDVLYVADATVNNGMGLLQKVSLATGASTPILFSLTSNESGSRDVSIGANGRSLLTTFGNGNHPLRSFVVGQDVISQRTDLDLVSAPSTLRRSGDRKRILLLQSNSSVGPINLYDAGLDVVTPNHNTSFSLSSSVSAVSRDATKFAIDSGFDVQIRSASLSPLSTISNARGGLCYDPNENILYCIDHSSDQVIARNSITNEELYRLNIGEDVNSSNPFDAGEISVSPDSRWLFVSTPSGIRQIRLAGNQARVLIVRDLPPAMIRPLETIAFPVRVITNNDALVPGTAQVHFRTDTAAYQSAPMIDLGDGNFQVNLPGVECGQTVQYYLTADGAIAGTTIFPPVGQQSPFQVMPNHVPDCNVTLSLPWHNCTDLFYDNSNHRLYASTTSGFVERLDMNTGRLLEPIMLGSQLGQMDVDLENAHLYISEVSLFPDHNYFHKLDLASMQSSIIEYPSSALEISPVDIIISANNRALFATSISNTPTGFLHELNLFTNAHLLRTDLPMLRDPASLARSADRNTVTLSEGGSPDPRISVLDIASQTIVGNAPAGNAAPGYTAVSRNGNVIASSEASSWTLYNRDMSILHTFANQGGGAIAWDPLIDLIYRCNAATNRIHLTSLQTMLDIATIDVGYDIVFEGANGLYAPGDDRLLFARTLSAVRLIALPQGDCNNNGVPDLTEIAQGQVTNCNSNALPDSCELEVDCNANSIPDDCEIDCNENAIPDECEISQGDVVDCDDNLIPDECQMHADSINEWLSQLSASHAQITSLIPNRYDFTDGFTGTRISDGGFNMFDIGNRLNTNRASNINYTNNQLVSGTIPFGPGSLYFTAKFTGIFVLAVQDMSLTSFQITGGLGADGAGAVDDATIPFFVNGTRFTLFLKRVWNATPPSVNHLFVVRGNGQSIVHTFSNNTDNDLDTYSGLNGIEEMFYVLVARQSGLYLSNVQAISVASTLVSNLGIAGEDCNNNAVLDRCESDCNMNSIPDECDIMAGTSQDANMNGIPDECSIAVVGDLNCDQLVNLQDIPYFIDALASPATFMGCDITLADMNADSLQDGADVQAFVSVLLEP